jgi:hypothetical protein
MPKKAVLATIDAKPSAVNGELATGATVIQVTQLSISEPLSGDLQIVDEGRLIVGDNPDIGQRVIVTKHGIFNHDRDGIMTFAAVSKDAAPLAAGDVFAGYQAGNYLLFDQSAGTVGVYSPAGAGFIAAADGSLYAGDTDGAHMRWNTASRAIEVRNGEYVKISLDANGDAMFDGTVYASAGRIYGAMQVDGLLRAGDVDGPSVSLGRFSRVDGGGDLVESGEIIVTDASNMPWFHVTAGGSTANGGWFHLGGTGDYPQRLTYDGQDLVFDGTLYARDGDVGGWVIGDEYLASANGEVRLSSINGVQIVADGDWTNVQETNAVSWHDNATYANRIGWIYGALDGSESVIIVEAEGRELDYAAAIQVQSLGGTGKSGVARMGAYGGGVDTNGATFTLSATGVGGGATALIIADITGVASSSTRIGDGGATNYSQFDATGHLTFAGTANIAPVLATTTQTADYVATAADTVIVCNKATAMTVTLPAATGLGKLYHIKSINTGVVTVDGNGADTIDGQTTQALNQWDALQIVDYAPNAWAIL